MAVNRTDAGMQQLINMFGDCIKIEKVWENASPNSSFPAQNIKFDTTKYDGFVITMHGGSTSADNTDYKDPYNYWLPKTAKRITGYPINQTVNAVMAIPVRSISITTTGITFGGGAFKIFTATASNANDIYAVPEVIYGVKGVK